MLGAYDFRRFGTIADIGGGRGHLPDVIASDVQHDRLAAPAGDFFADGLPAADAYVLMEVMHDWPDEEGVTILKNIRVIRPCLPVGRRPGPPPAARSLRTHL